MELLDSGLIVVCAVIMSNMVRLFKGGHKSVVQKQMYRLYYGHFSI